MTYAFSRFRRAGQIPAELLAGLKRDFEEAELAVIFSNIHKTVAPAKVAQPAALFILGAAALSIASRALLTCF